MLQYLFIIKAEPKQRNGTSHVEMVDEGYSGNENVNQPLEKEDYKDKYGGQVVFQAKVELFLKSFGTVKTVNPTMAAKPSHQTAGLPSKTMVDVVPLGRMLLAAKVEHACWG